MKDHGELDDDEMEQVLGAMVVRVVDQVNFAGPGAVAVTGFAIGDVVYEISVKVKS